MAINGDIMFHFKWIFFLIMFFYSQVSLSHSIDKDECLRKLSEAERIIKSKAENGLAGMKVWFEYNDCSQIEKLKPQYDQISANLHLIISFKKLQDHLKGLSQERYQSILDLASKKISEFQLDIEKMSAYLSQEEKNDFQIKIDTISHFLEEHKLFKTPITEYKLNQLFEKLKEPSQNNGLNYFKTFSISAFVGTAIFLYMKFIMHRNERRHQEAAAGLLDLQRKYEERIRAAEKAFFESEDRNREYRQDLYEKRYGNFDGGFGSDSDYDSQSSEDDI